MGMAEDSVIVMGAVERRIRTIRGEQVMLDSDLAELYEVETKAVVRAMKRNAERFPADFMFQLSETEWQDLRCQIGTSSYGGRRYRPYAFTEQGVAMLSSVLSSTRAVQVNIAIMRAFVQLRRMAGDHKDLLRKVNEMERKYDDQFKVVFSAIKRLMEPPPVPKKKIGF